MNVTRQTVVTPCPECETDLDLGPQPRLGQNITCPECWAYLKIISLEPLALAWDVEEIDAEWSDEQGVDWWLGKSWRKL